MLKNIREGDRRMWGCVCRRLVRVVLWRKREERKDRSQSAGNVSSLIRTFRKRGRWGFWRIEVGRGLELGRLAFQGHFLILTGRKYGALESGL